MRLVLLRHRLAQGLMLLLSLLELLYGFGPPGRACSIGVMDSAVDTLI
jgi:hypothetical protein